MDTLIERYEADANLLRLAAAFADPDRLAVVGLLVRREMTVEELVNELELDAATVGKHLAVLGNAALVSTRKDGNRRLLSLRLEALAELSDWCAAQQEDDEPPFEVPDGVRQFFARGRLISFPARQSKKIEVLRVLVQDFDPGVDYSESEVNQILLKRYPDFATLRRALIDEGMMTRTSGIYRRSI
jgi:hypothetical protein